MTDLNPKIEPLPDAFGNTPASGAVPMSEIPPGAPQPGPRPFAPMPPPPPPKTGLRGSDSAVIIIALILLIICCCVVGGIVGVIFLLRGVVQIDAALILPLL